MAKNAPQTIMKNEIGKKKERVPLSSLLHKKLGTIRQLCEMYYKYL